MSKIKDRSLQLPDVADLPDEVLVSLVKAGETKAYKYFFWEYCDYVNLLTHSLLPSEEDARLVMQQIMQDVWTKRKKSYLRTPLKPFLYQEVYRKCRPYLSDKKKPLLSRLFG